MQDTNWLVNQVSLKSILLRHYQRTAMVEARKVLGGAGPAIATIPASLIWASISFLELARDLTYRRVGLQAFVPRTVFYGATALGQVRGRGRWGAGA
eukprot:276258-Chlamydomonas_euryale.AAC.1